MIARIFLVSLLVFCVSYGGWICFGDIIMLLIAMIAIAVMFDSLTFSFLPRYLYDLGIKERIVNAQEMDGRADEARLKEVAIRFLLPGCASDLERTIVQATGHPVIRT